MKSIRAVLGLSVLAACASCAAEPAGTAPLAEPLVAQAPTGLQRLDRVVSAVSAEAAARAVLGDDSLLLLGARQGQAGTYVRFQRTHAGLPVLGCQVVVLVRPEGQAWRALMLNPGRQAPAQVAMLPDVAPPAGGSRVVWPGDRKHPAQVAYLSRQGYRELVIGGSGEVLSDRDVRRFVDGTGLVFDPSPVVSLGDTTLRDNNDANSTTLDGARVSVTLPRLDGSGFLRGDYADARPASAAARASSGVNSFSFQRADDHFEEVMAYYHLDRAQDHLRGLGFSGATAINGGRQVAVVNAFADDNSFFDPGSGQLEFGAGGVDDAEDADIVLHEYGHAIQNDQVPGFGGGGDADSLGEGFGDYLAATLSEAFGNATADSACVGDWDAVEYDNRNPPCLRRVDGPKHYPEGADGEAHDDGEMWSAGLWLARDTLGGDVLDRLVLESQFAYTTSQTFQQASDGLIMADADLNAGANATVLRRALVARGLSRTLTPPSPLGGVAGSMNVSVDNPRQGASYVTDLDDTQTVTFPGAQAVRVHFDMIDTEDDAQCLGGGCDNIYLYDAAGDLYQILHGSRGAVDSVSIPGDTIKIRLVTDFSVNATGYHVSRIDSMDDSTPPPDAGVELPDAGTIDNPDASAGQPDASPMPGDDDGGGGGCGCQVGGRGGEGAAAAGLGVLVLGLVLRRRRR